MAKHHPLASKINAELDKVGLRLFTDDEIKAISERLKKTISIGLKRKGKPVTTDGGVLAAPSGIGLITARDMAKIPDHKRGITAACGGTNWIFAETQKEPNGEVVIGRSFVRFMPESERKHTYQSFIDIIASGIYKIAEECSLQHEKNLAISISLGFPQINSQAKNGDVDARFDRKKLPKFWEIIDYNEKIIPERQPSLAKLLRENLKSRGIKGVGRIAILNDTVAVAMDVRSENIMHSLPAGFVFGTGTNGAMYGGAKKGMVNLEMGWAEVMEADEILRRMQRKGWAQHNGAVMEYWMGGTYIAKRMMAGIELLDKFVSSSKEINKQILNSENKALISDMARGRESPLVGLSLPADDYLLAKICAKRALHQAAQVIGTQLAVVAEMSGCTRGTYSVPFEGSVLGKGYGVKKKALEVAKYLLPNLTLEPYEASGMVGVGKLAMARTFSKK